MLNFISHLSAQVESFNFLDLLEVFGGQQL